MSGTAFGTAVLHVAPESAKGAPLALVQSGDQIALDVDKQRLGYGTLFLDHVLQANEGCDFGFLRREDRTTSLSASRTGCSAAGSAAVDSGPSLPG